MVQTILFAVKKFYICIMKRIEAYRGIAPGKVIAYDLSRKGISQRAFAAAIGEHSQTLNAVIDGRRKLPLRMALVIERTLGYEEGFLSVLQIYYEIKKMQSTSLKAPDLPIPRIRKVVFWDIDMSTLDWQKSRDFIINRVMSKGNNKEIAEIKKYYGIE